MVSCTTWDHAQKYSILVLCLQILFVGLFAAFADYGDDASSGSTTPVGIIYPFFQDVHVMVFVGFGFLMTFLKRYGFSSVGFNFMISCLMIQWGILVNGFWHQVGNGSPWHEIRLDIASLIDGDFAAAAVLITFGAVLGKVSPLQLAVIGFLELIFYGANFCIGSIQFKAVDMGGSMFVHTFGAYFGLACSRVLTKKKITRNHPLNSSDYRSDLFAMIGTLFLWMFWPSFNGALAKESQQFRVIINTVLSLSASCAMAFAASAFFRKARKFDMVDIQNATLAGGVAVGSSADLVISPWGAVLIGMCAGCVSVLGYVYLSPFLERKFGIHDTCGVNNLHGVPGIMGGLGGTVTALLAGSSVYGDDIGKVFPARDPNGLNRSAGEQAGFQFATLCVTVGIAIVSGTFTGFVAKLKIFEQPEDIFHDKEYWELPQDIEDELENEHNQAVLENRSGRHSRMPKDTLDVDSATNIDSTSSPSANFHHDDITMTTVNKGQKDDLV